MQQGKVSGTTIDYQELYLTSILHSSEPANPGCGPSIDITRKRMLSERQPFNEDSTCLASDRSTYKEWKAYNSNFCILFQFGSSVFKN